MKDLPRIYRYNDPSVFLKPTVIKKTLVIPQETEKLAFLILICSTTRLVVHIEDVYC